MSAGDGTGGEGRTVSLWAALATALALLVGVRLFTFDAVFRGSDVVLLSNDPYVFLYLVERALTDGGVSRAAPEVFWRSEPLLIWTLAAASLLLGGVERAPLVLALYPPVTALLSGVFVFVLGRTVTEDARVGVVAVVVLAVTPLHASRTALGFADHHAFDYFWLLLTATVLTWLLVRFDAERRVRWAAGGVLGAAVAGQTLAWGVSPLMLVPTAAAVGVAAPVLMRADAPPRSMAPVVGGFALAAAVVQLVHRTLVWQSTVVAAVPVLLFAGSAAVFALMVLAERADRSWPTLLAAEAFAVVVAAGVLWVAAPGLVGGMADRIAEFGAYVEARQGSGIGETAPITEAFGPVLGPLVLLGFGPFLGLPVVGWSVVRGWREREVGWFVLAPYVVWFLALAFVQRRFAVQLGLFLSVFAAIGFLAFAYWLALVLPPVAFRDDPGPPDQRTLELPDRRRLALLCGFGAVGVGSGALYSIRILSQVAIDDDAYAAAAWMREYAAARDWAYPRNYVLAHWGRVRMYNYFVSGQARQYVYARQNYEAFLFDSDADAWYDQFEGRVGFVVTRDDIDAGSFRVHSQLHDAYGSATAGNEGVGHFRAAWESDDGTTKAFTLVPGATVVGQASPDSTVSLSTAVAVDGTGRSVPYRRRAETDSAGRFSVVVAHPGEYEFDGSRRVAVDESAVLNGERVEADS